MAFVSGSSTPFGIFDHDAQFRADADKLINFVATKLGDSWVQVELSSSDVYASFEEAAVEYSSIINSYQAKSSLAAFLGSPTGSLAGGENRYPQFSLEWQRRMAQGYADQAGVGGTMPLYSGSVALVANQQTYNLQATINPTGSDGQSRQMIIRDIFHFSPLSAYRFFGTTSAINYLNNQFSFESYTPETVFYMLPVWEDVLRGMQFEMSNKVRRSNYSFEIHNNVLTVYPVPTQALNLHFRYQLADESMPVPGISSTLSGSADRQSFGVSNMSNVPFGNIQYSALNSMSKTWIWQMTLAFCKEIMGYIRRKMGTLPIPEGDVSLDGGEMVADAKSDMERLRNDLKALLEETTYDKLAAKEAEKAESLYRNLMHVPLKIYVG